MTDLEVVIEKTNNIQNCLARIQNTLQNELARLDELDVQDIVVLNLQRATQLVIDIASHVVSTEKLGIPQSLKDLFILLQKNQILTAELSLKMQKMIGFRNIAVHDYQAINLSILKSILSLHLQDFENFYTAILLFAKKNS